MTNSDAGARRPSFQFYRSGWSARDASIGAVVAAVCVAAACASGGHARAQAALEALEDLEPSPVEYRSLPPGSKFEWRFAAAGDDAPETVEMRVLASGPSFMIQTSLAPFDLITEDYALFLEYKGVGVLDCVEPTTDAEIEATLEEADGLWPLRPGVRSGRFSIDEQLGRVGAGGPAPSGSETFVIAEASEEGLTKLHWSAKAGALVQIEWFDGGRDLLKSIEPNTAVGQTQAEAAGVVPGPCRRALPKWLWERLGVAF